MSLIALIIVLVLAIVYLLVGLLIARLVLRWLVSLFQTDNNGSGDASQLIQSSKFLGVIKRL